jgi:hypothetical protein
MEYDRAREFEEALVEGSAHDGGVLDVEGGVFQQNAVIKDHASVLLRGDGQLAAYLLAPGVGVHQYVVLLHQGAIGPGGGEGELSGG